MQDTVTVQVSSVFLYVSDVARSVEFYNEVMGAEIRQLHPDPSTGEPLALAILRLGSFTIMLHPQEPYAEQFEGTRPGVGMHLQVQVDDVERFHQHCLDQGALMSLSGDPVQQEWGWKEFAVRDPDGYIWSIYQDMTDGMWQ